ncbi:MAG: ABC transporter permease subunit, partial [Actinomycetota bacterium]
SPFEFLIGTMPVLVFAYVVHFGALALRTAQVAVSAVPRRMDDAARLLGASRLRRLLTVDLPIMAPGLAAGAGLDEVPPYLASSLTFPYVAGPTFVCNAYAEGGWDAVDALLQAPPATTAEVLFGEPVDPVDPEPLTGPEGHELVEERTFGAAQLSWLFAAPGGDISQALDDPVEQVRGWQGGRISLWRQADTTEAGGDVVALSFVDDGGLCDAVTVWWQRTEPRLGDRVGTIVCRGDQVMVGVADDEETAMAALGG